MAPSPTIRRLLKETSELSASSKNPNPAFHAGPVSDTDLHEWHFTLLGPPAPSPYAGGLYHGRISLPPSYPLKPPNFRFLTPSGRFEVNREICLSISGFHEETWMPAWGVRTALTALRSFMAESGTAGQVGGLEAPKDVREQLAKESRAWRCKECGNRANEEIMSEWWEACAAKGVKVGEDVGLEVLPEGLSLVAKTPQKREDKGKAREEPTPETTTASTDMANGEASNPDPPTDPLLSHLPPPYKPIHSTHSSISQAPTIQPSSQPPQHLSSHSRHSSTVHPPSSPPPRPTPTTNLPAHRSTPSTTSITSQLRPATSPDQSTLTIDRAIYIVFVALFIMVIKKIFYPAGGNVEWENYALVRD